MRLCVTSLKLLCITLSLMFQLLCVRHYSPFLLAVLLSFAGVQIVSWSLLPAAAELVRLSLFVFCLFV